ncbi:hypothetical protein [Nocardia sp. NPDC051570]|uniref:hypothetical protein n=1 Tax=Nocardia sp. NPDC051570 TaxID=3364324 RepID=UPI003797C894
MSVRTRVDAPDRGSRRSAQPAERQSAPRRAESAERVKSGAAQRAYARRRSRTQGRDDLAPLPGRTASAMTGRLPFVVGIIALLGCGLALTLLLTTRAAEDSYQLGDSRRLNRQLGDERDALQREVAAADSAPELANRARELGMIPAKDPVRLIVAPDGSVTVIGKETPADGPPVPPLNPAPSAVPPPAPNLNQAKGEHVVPVVTQPKPAQNAPAGQPNPNAAAQAPAPPTPGQIPAAAGPQPATAPGQPQPAAAQGPATPVPPAAPQPPAPAPPADPAPPAPGPQTPAAATAPLDTVAPAAPSQAAPTRSDPQDGGGQ